MNDNSDQNKKSNDEIPPEILAYKEQFKKQNTGGKTTSLKPNISNFKIIRLFPYLFVILGFALGLYILVLLFDNYIIPNVVHDRQIINVPNIVGLNIEKAEKELSSFSLSFEIAAEQYSDDVPPNTVIRQLPAPGTEVREGRPIYLTISKGKETVTVPSLVGFDLRSAKLEIMKLGLKLGDISFEHSEIYPKDTILAQSISPGSKVEFGKTIHLTLSKGSKEVIIMPLIIGQNIEDIMFFLENYGLRLGNVSYKESETYQANVIIDQSPKEYEEIQLGTYVNITVSQ